MDLSNWLSNSLYWIIFALPSIIIGSTVHEYFHALAAYKLGDLTAKVEGRLTLNPLAHIDPFGVLAMLIARIGWSKPVPINSYNFENPVLGTAITAAAGPLSNLVLAVVAAGIHFVTKFNPVGIIEIFTAVNLSLFVFNLIPIPPLDGHKIFGALLPSSLRYHWENLEKYSIIIIALLFLPFSPLSGYASAFITGILNYLLRILGF